MVEGAALEKRWVERPREFESHPLRYVRSGSPDTRFARSGQRGSRTAPIGSWRLTPHTAQDDPGWLIVLLSGSIFSQNYLKTG